MNSTKRIMPVRVVAGCCLLVLVACTQVAERDAVCVRAERWNAASTAVAEIFSDVETTSPGRLQDVFTEIVSTLTTLSDVAPSAIEIEVEKLRVTYESLANALRDLDWQGGLVAQDAPATSAAVRLASNEIALAQRKLSDYITSECNVAIQNVINTLPAVGTTLPDPIIQDDTTPLPDVGFGNDESALQAFGFVVSERFGVAITTVQAMCVGTLLADAAVSNDGRVDATYWEILQAIFDECQVNIDVASSLDE